MGKPYRVCPACGAHLDAGEVCDDCRERDAEERANICKQGPAEKAAEPRHFEGQKAG